MKKSIFTIIAFLTVVCMSGCTPKVAQIEKYIHEVGHDLPEDVTVYAEFNDLEDIEEALLNFEEVDTETVGTYEAFIILGNEKYPFAIEVIDTKEPQVWTKNNFAKAGIDTVISADSFGVTYADASEIAIGFRNITLEKTESELYAIFAETFKDTEYLDKYLQLEEVIGISYDEKKDVWSEKDINLENILPEFKPTENGLYKIELVVTDSSNNATIRNCYVLSDLVTPILPEELEIEISLKEEFNFYDVMDLLQDNLTATDEMLGEAPYIVEISSADFEFGSSNIVNGVVECSAKDFGGNEATAEYDFKIINRKINIKETTYYAPSTMEDVIITEGNVTNVALCLEGLNRLPTNVVNRFLASGWHIILTDRELGENIAGSTYWSNHTIVIPDNEGSKIPTIVAHEMGHFLGGSTGTPWKSSEFASIWAEEKDAFAATGGYNGTNSYSQMEFFSQVFCDTYSTGYAKNVAPKAYEFVQRYVNQL